MVQFASSGHRPVVSVNEGQAAIIDLPPIDCYPAPRVYWLNVLTGVRIEYSRLHYHLTLDNRLIILSTQMNRDNGTMFRANAQNIYTSDNSLSPTYLISVNGENRLLAIDVITANIEIIINCFFGLVSITFLL